MDMIKTVWAGAALTALAACGDPAAASSQDAAAALGFAPQEPASVSGTSAATGQLKTVEIVDRLGFDRPMLVGRIDVPADWRAEGGVNWDGSTNCAANQMKFQWRAVAPDGVAAIEMMPGYAWQSPAAYIPMNPCPVERIGSARDFLAIAARAMRPGARVIYYRERTDLSAQAQRNDRPGYRTEVGEMTIAYAARGVPVEEVLSAMVSVSGAAGNVGYVVGWRAPAGKLDHAAFERVRRSFKGNMEYARAMGQRGMNAVNRFSQQQSAAISQWHNARMAEINARGAADRAAIRARGAAETNAIYAETARGTSAANDRMYDSNLRALKEETTWTNPNTGEVVQGSIHGGERVLQQSDGSYARTDDPYYNPPGSTEYEPQ